MHTHIQPYVSTHTYIPWKLSFCNKKNNAEDTITVMYLDRLSFHTDYNKAVVYKKRLENLGAIEKKGGEIRNRARGSNRSGGMKIETTGGEKKIMRAIVEKSVPFGDRRGRVLNKYIIILVHWGVFNPFVSFIRRNQLFSYSLLFLSIFFLLSE